MKKQILSLAKGQFISVETKVSAEKINESMYKKVEGRPNPYFGRITKEVKHSGIRVCDYENMAAVIAEREEGKEARAPWYEWEAFPYLAKGKKNGNEYFVVKTTENYRANVQYYLDGEEVEYSEIAHLFKASSKSEELPRVLTLDLRFIQAINGK